MVVLTAKVDFKKMMLILGAAAVVLLALIVFRRQRADLRLSGRLGHQRAGCFSQKLRLGGCQLSEGIRPGADSGPDQ